MTSTEKHARWMRRCLAWSRLKQKWPSSPCAPANKKHLAT
eukprot:CAMPEP_0185176184 /NCGR_PEP_ID=MMETSP1139-20130426/27973_1 /TAXON_ID=298111 /ORGANISM="Pavlova sp., Strain CCMP459" /LENGTH=39 /DNA_ID= /DNA_START= /DNA_END= /DNA_ORIENTATION=